MNLGNIQYSGQAGPTLNGLLEALLRKYGTAATATHGEPLPPDAASTGVLSSVFAGPVVERVDRDGPGGQLEAVLRQNPPPSMERTRPWEGEAGKRRVAEVSRDEGRRVPEPVRKPRRDSREDRW